MCSLYEFIFSCRDSKNDPFPKFNSLTTTKALHMMKKIKNELSLGIK